MEKDDERDKRMQETAPYKRAMKQKQEDSAVYKSQKRTFASMKGFMLEVGERNKRSGFKQKLFTDENELRQECNGFITYCMDNEIIPTWNLLSVWLNCNQDTLYAVVNQNDKRSEELQKTRTILFTILEQIALEREGNPAAPIFFMKSMWGLSDQQAVDVNINMSGPSQTTLPDEVENLINLTPDEYHDT